MKVQFPGLTFPIECTPASIADCLRAHGVVFMRSKASGYGIKFANRFTRDELIAKFTDVALSSPDELFGHLIPMPDSA